MNRPSLDERKNVRPYVLGACFVWGLLFGFLFYVLRDHNPEPVDPEKDDKKSTHVEVPDNTSGTLFVTEPGKNADQNPGNPDNGNNGTENVETVAVTPPKFAPAGLTPPTPTPAKKIEDESPTATAVKRLTTQAPTPAPLALNPAWGLSGHTVRPPERPVVAAPKPGSTASGTSGAAGTSSAPTRESAGPKPVKPIKLDDLPELDL